MSDNLNPCYVCARKPHLYKNVGPCEPYIAYKYICGCGNCILLGSETVSDAAAAWNERQLKGANVPRNEPVVPMYDDGKWVR